MLNDMKRFPIKISLGIIITLYFAFNIALKPAVYTIQSSKITSPIKLALITDLHGCYYGENQKRLVQAIDKGKPDAILLGGDIFDDVQPDTHTLKFLKAIANRYPIYYVTGNHEFWRTDVESVFTTLEALNIKVLQGDSVELNIRDTNIALHGIDDPFAEWYYDEPNRIANQLTQLSDTLDQKKFNLLIAHRPSQAETYLSYGFDLVTSGHAHGGQWRIPYLLNGLLAPDEGLFPKLAGGHYTFSNGELIVSRGLALESTRVPRIFNRPEVVFIHLN